jgi:hypothetical protein
MTIITHFTRWAIGMLSGNKTENAKRGSFARLKEKGLCGTCQPRRANEAIGPFFSYTKSNFLRKEASCRSLNFSKQPEEAGVPRHVACSPLRFLNIPTQHAGESIYKKITIQTSYENPRQAMHQNRKRFCSADQ